MTGFAVFETAIGECAVAWNERGVSGVHLPERDDAALRRRVARAHPDAVESTPTETVRGVIDDMTAVLRGEPVDLRSVELDLTGVPEFHRRVYDVARTIPPGATMTYGEIAVAVEDIGASRAVGQALGRNPFPIVVPCHRVVAADGRIGGFSATGGPATKRRLLSIEGAPGYDAPTLFDVAER
jgi:methylated-DNA-[protein]-cysteine S-methyltransferase